MKAKGLEIYSLLKQIEAKLNCVEWDNSIPNLAPQKNRKNSNFLGVKIKRGHYVYCVWKKKM